MCFYPVCLILTTAISGWGCGAGPPGRAAPCAPGCAEGQRARERGRRQRGTGRRQRTAAPPPPARPPPPAGSAASGCAGPPSRARPPPRRPPPRPGRHPEPRGTLSGPAGRPPAGRRWPPRDGRGPPAGAGPFAAGPPRARARLGVLGKLSALLNAAPLFSRRRASALLAASGPLHGLRAARPTRAVPLPGTAALGILPRCCAPAGARSPVCRLCWPRYR